MGAFERVAAVRGVEAPRVRRPSLHVVPEPAAAPVETVAHRPVRFAEVVGQGELVMRLGTHLRAAVARGAQPGHVLLDGPAGTGKTTLAQAMATELTELGVPSRCHELTADAIANPRKLAIELAQLNAGDVLFLDEVQAMKTSVQTALLRVMEDRVMYVDASSKQPAIRFDVPAFTLVAATTHSGRLSNPLRDRFKLVGHLEQYDVEELQLLVLAYCERIDVSIDFDAAEIIAKASRYTPRRAVRLTDAVRDFAFEVTGDVNAPIDSDTAELGLEYAGVDSMGLESRDRRVMRVLLEQFDGGPIGLAPLACALNMDVTEMSRDVEPYLLQAGLWQLLPGGRGATKATWQVVTGSVPLLVNGRMR
jgi:Holliday junction DNA helicase RuvB